MSGHEKLRLRAREIMPTSELLEQTLSGSYRAYKAFQDALPGLGIEQDWQWYTPHKAWFAKGQYRWTTRRGARKEKNLYWLHIYEGTFSVTVWFLEKNRAEVLKADVSEKTKRLIWEVGTMGKVATFPVMSEISTVESLCDVYALIECKKRLET